MKYENIVKGEFIERPNRFIARVIIDGNTETVHVKNTGRCRELLIKGRTVYLSRAANPERKTKYDLIAVDKDGILINMDSQIPNSAAEEWLRKGNIFSENAVIRREVTYGKSRFDLYIEDGDRRVFLEVKGVTLEENGVVMFPDAPTERGVKHINELVKSLKDGYEAYILFVVQMKGVKYFCPNYKTHPEFADALKKAADEGVKVLAAECSVTPETIEISKEIEVKL